MLAALSGNLKLVQFLVGKGADIHHKNDYGETALMAAAISGNLELVQFLNAISMTRTGLKPTPIKL